MARLFQSELGTGYQQWRQQWRLLRAVERLALNVSLGEIADELGFASDSAFIAFFRGMTGLTPGAWSRTATPG